MAQLRLTRTTFTPSALLVAAFGLLSMPGCGGDEEETGAGQGAATTSECERMRLLNPSLVCAPPAPTDDMVMGSPSTPPAGADSGGFVGSSDEETAAAPTATGPVSEDTACADSNTFIGRSSPAALELLVDTSCSMSQAPAPMGGGMMGGMMMGGGTNVLTGPDTCPTELPEAMPFTCSFGMTEGSKWQITRDALFDALEQFSAATWLGLMFYPYPPATPTDQMFAGVQCECYPDVDVFIPQDTVRAAAFDAAQSALVTTALNDAIVNGSTPTHAAYLQAVDYIRSSTFTGDKYVVLITDGDPTYGLTAEGTCFGGGIARVDSTALIADVTAAYASGIYTYVIGSPGSENARVDLSRMAEEGGTARPDCSSAADSELFCHLDMTTEPDFATALASALGTVVEQTQDPCTYAVPMPPNGEELDRGRVNVSYTNEAGTKVEVPRDPSMTDCNSGWQYSADQNSIVLCPDVCSILTASGNTDVDILVGCRPTTIGTGAR